MTTFAEMQAEVIANTKRPELVDLTNSAIKMATLRAHHVDFFPRDYSNQLITYTPPVGNELFVDVANIFTTVTRLRTPNFMQSEDLTTLQATENLEFLSDYKWFWNEYNELRYSVFTFLGSTMRARFASATGRARLYFYQNPDTSSSTYSSWIADEHKEELAKWAAGIVWARAGFLEIAKSMDQTVQDFKSLLVESYMTGKV